MNGVKPRVLLITGMHRSGTSLAAALLQSSGLHIGERLLGPSPSNLRGHFENLDFVEFHQSILRARGLDENGWTVGEPLSFDEATEGEARRLIRASEVSPVWGWKDPRTVLLLNDWSALIPDAVFLFVHRAPWDVADSLYRRSSEFDRPFLENPSFAIDVWSAYNETIIRFHDAQPDRCLLVSVHTVMRNASGLISALNGKFGLGLSDPQGGIVEDQLLRIPRGDDQGFLLIETHRPDVLRTYRDLLSRSLDPEEAADTRWFGESARMDRTLSLFHTWLDLRLAEKRGAEAAAQIATLRSSSQEDLRRLATELERTQRHLHETFENASAERSRLLSELAGLQAESEHRWRELDAMSAQRHRLDEALQSATSEGARLSSELAVLRAAAELLRGDLGALREELEKERSHREDALRRGTVHRLEADSLRTEGQVLRAELRRSRYYLDETMRNAVAERSRLDAELVDARTRIDLIEGEGIRNTLQRLRHKIDNKRVKLTRRYAPWLRGNEHVAVGVAVVRNESSAAADLSAAQFWNRLEPALKLYASALPAAPVRMSILTPTWNCPLSFFVEAAKSVLAQSTTGWEWCIVDDGSTRADFRAVLAELGERSPRIRVSFELHHGISAATNRALSQATGSSVCFLDQDDVLLPTALAEMLEKISKGYDVAYSDQQKVDVSGRPCEDPLHKPSWSPEYLRGVMYVGHLLAVNRELALRAGGFNGEFDGVQDFEFMLRLTETTGRIGHVPKILYQWRRADGSVAADPGAKPNIDKLQRAAVNAHLTRIGLAACAENGIGPHRLKIVPGPRLRNPLVSIIIPTRDAPGFLGRCLESIKTLTTYPHYEVVLIDNDTTDPEALEIMARSGAQRVPFPGTFNYSRANNLGAAKARGEYLLFLNNDTEVMARDWIENLLFYAEQPDVGAVGGLLLYLDGSVQHAGIVLGMRGTADHVMRGFPAHVDGYAGSLVCAREVSAVTGACLMLSAERFREGGGFNEHYATHYQDVDLCVRLLTSGYRNIFTPRCVLHHFESATRGTHFYDVVDRMLLLDRWYDEIDGGDRFYNRNFDIDRIDYALRTRP